MSDENPKSGPELPEHCPGPESKDAGYEDTCQGCPNRSACQSGKPYDPVTNDPEVEAFIQSVQTRIIVMSGKGGVGKSTITALLALGLASRRGLEVGLIDGDLCGPNIPKLLNIQDETVHRVMSCSSAGETGKSMMIPVMAHENLTVISSAFLLRSRADALIWRGPKKNGLLKQFVTDVQWVEPGGSGVDCVIVDTPPGTSDEHLSLCGLLKPTGAVIVTQSHILSIRDVQRQITFCKKLQIPIVAVVENMSSVVCPDCGQRSRLFKSDRQNLTDLVETVQQQQSKVAKVIEVCAASEYQSLISLFSRSDDDPPPTHVNDAIEQLCNLVSN